MTTMIQRANAQPTELAPGGTFTREKLELIKRTICRGATDDEFELFMHACQRTGLDPLVRQIHAVKRWQDGREVMTVQTGIDGYRLIADRTGKYMPGRETTFAYDEHGNLISATAYVKKLGPDGQWHEIAGTARFDEYVGKKKDGSPNMMWGTKPHIMTGKCAEAIALRKAFPAELSGVYTSEEMDQAANGAAKVPAVLGATATADQIEALHQLIDEARVPKQTTDKWLKAAKVATFEDLPAPIAQKCIDYCRAQIESRQASQEAPAEEPAQSAEEDADKNPVKRRAINFDAFEKKARALGKSAGKSEREADTAIAKFMAQFAQTKNNMESDTMHTLLEAMEEGRFDWKTGAVSMPAGAA